MDSPELFIAFGALMLVTALLGVAVDWFGKPLRHRRFVPKIYRFPDERQPRRSQVRATEWSDASLVLPVADQPVERVPLRYPEPGVGVLDEAPSWSQRDIGPPTEQVQVVWTDDEDAGPVAVHSDDASNTGGDNDHGHPDHDTLGSIVTLEDADPDNAELARLVAEAPDHADSESGVEGERTRGWRPGQYVFNLTPDGDEPSSTTVRVRYWKNVAETGGAGLFGDSNLARMGDGKPPQRRNHRTGKTESMQLPTASYAVTEGRTPVPQWPAAEMDPFA